MKCLLPGRTAFLRWILSLSGLFFSFVIFAQCPANEADFANGGSFSGPCNVDYNGEVTITGAVIWTGGTMVLEEMDGDGLIIANGGSLTIQAGTFTLDDDTGDDISSFISVEQGGTLTVQGGTLNVENDLDVAGTVIIESGGTLNTTENGDIDVASTGSITVSGTLNSNDDMTIDDGGSITVNSGGTLDINDDADINGELVVSGDFDADDLDVGGTGSLDVNSGGTVDVNDDVQIDDGGSVTIDSGADFDAGDNITVDGDLTVDGNLDADDLYVDPTGNVDVNAGSTVNIDNGEVVVDGTMTIAGDVTTAADFNIDGGTVTVENGGSIDSGDDIQVFGGGTLEIQAGGTAHADDDLRNQEDGGGAGEEGTIIVDGSLDVDGDLTINDTDPDSGLSGSGSVDVNGTMDDQESGPFSACGSFPCDADFLVEITAPNSTLSAFTATIQFGQSVTGFTIDDITESNATLSNFTAVDGDTYTVLVTPSGAGDITLNVAADVVNETNYAAIQTTTLYGLAAGDVMIIGYSTESDATTLGDGIAFVTLVDLPANQVLYFTDNEWDDANDQWINDNTDSNDTYYTWTNGGTVLPSGSVVVIYGTAAQTFTTEGGGSTTSAATQEIGQVTNTNEVIYLYTADAANDPASTVFLSALATDGFDAGGGYQRGDLPSELTVGTNAIEFTDDEELTLYNGSTECSGTQLECQQMIADPNNWATNLADNGSGGSTVVWPPVDGPVDSDTDFGGSLLPVELVSFEASLYENQQIVLLEWTTATEINNEGFLVQRSDDGVDFYDLGFVEGNGNSSALIHYNFFDNQIFRSSYYRLKQMDFDGKFEYSPTVFLSLVTDGEEAIAINPNPVVERVMVSGMVNEIYDFTLSDLAGNLIVKPIRTDLSEVETILNQEVSFLPAGVYLLHFHNPGYSRTIRLIKQ